jgi:hypothetical protein
MIIVINENIRIWSEFNPFELALNNKISNYFERQRIAIKKRWFDVLSSSELVRKQNKNDGYYRAVYIQIDMESGEYYIGKANRPTWSQLTRYQGSGLKFRSKFRKNKNRFVRYYIAACQTAEETEQLEASLVDKDLLSDENCLNLVAGGGGTSKHPSIAESSQKKREYIKSHPEQFKPMLEASKAAFQSGDTPALRARSRRIKEVMGAVKYREMTRKRIAKWRVENPEKYAEARRKNHERLRTPEVQAKRKASLAKWAENNPEKWKAWRERLATSRTSHRANDKRKASLKEWRDKNPRQAQANALKRAAAAALKLGKPVHMIDLGSGDTLKVFPSQHAAAKWLVENGKAKNPNCVSSISSVCLRKPCTTGYGYRKKAYGYGWRFAADIPK